MKLNTTLLSLVILTTAILNIQSIIMATPKTFKSESLFLQNDTMKPIIVRLNNIALSPLLPTKKKKINPEIIKNLEFKYKGYPDLSYTEPNIKSIVSTIKATKKDAIAHIEPGQIYGLRLGKTEFITIPMTKDEAHQEVLKILKISKTESYQDPLDKEVAGTILDINSSSTSAEAQKAFDAKFSGWHNNSASKDQLVTDYYSNYLYRALRAFKPTNSKR